MIHLSQTVSLSATMVMYLSQNVSLSTTIHNASTLRVRLPHSMPLLPQCIMHLSQTVSISSTMYNASTSDFLIIYHTIEASASASYMSYLPQPVSLSTPLNEASTSVCLIAWGISARLTLPHYIRDPCYIIRQPTGRLGVSINGLSDSFLLTCGGIS